MRVRKRQLSDAYRFDGFRPEAEKVRGVFGKPKARILPLKRRAKKVCAAVAVRRLVDGTIGKPSSFVICPVETPMFYWRLSSGVSIVESAAR
jgi:hypothetical protein